MKHHFYLAMMIDPDGLPRAWGKSRSKAKAESVARQQLMKYRQKKLELGDPLAIEDFSLVFEEGNE